MSHVRINGDHFLYTAREMEAYLEPFKSVERLRHHLGLLFRGNDVPVSGNNLEVAYRTIQTLEVEWELVMFAYCAWKRERFLLTGEVLPSARGHKETWRAV